MDHSRPHTPAIDHPRDAPLDAVARSLSTRLSRRGVLGLLATAALAGGAGAVATPATAGRRRKRGKRRSRQHGVTVSGRAAAIPPNCIYVCCDGTCDSWKMCLKCVKWPKPTTSGGVLAPA